MQLMREEVLFTLDTPYRQPLAVKGWRFGDPERKSLAVVGDLRGNEVQQMYICSQLIRALETLEEEGKLAPDCGVLVIPCANQFSMNVGRRFWAADNTDINRMFPGYDGGETTQRIAARIFATIQGYEYGVHFTSFYLPGNCLPHARIMETGYQRPEAALDFGLPYILLRKPQPYDTTTLNYNWQIWDTQAFSLYTRETDCGAGGYGDGGRGPGGYSGPLYRPGAGAAADRPRRKGVLRPQGTADRGARRGVSGPSGSVNWPQNVFFQPAGAPEKRRRDLGRTRGAGR